MSGRAELEVRCRQCGVVRADVTSARCGLDGGGQALCEVTCPSCLVAIFVATTPQVAETVLWYGGQENLRAPLELLEPHTGAPIGWDEVLDLHLALARASSPDHVDDE